MIQKFHEIPTIHYCDLWPLKRVYSYSIINLTLLLTNFFRYCTIKRGITFHFSKIRREKMTIATQYIDYWNKFDHRDELPENYVYVPSNGNTRDAVYRPAAVSNITCNTLQLLFDCEPCDLCFHSLFTPP